MKKMMLLLFAMVITLASIAQFSSASLKASGLTCAMCSKAVKVALEKVPFVQEVKVNIKTQDYVMTFKEGSDIEFDELKKAVEDAGFSVAALKVTAVFNGVTLEKDKHLVLGGKTFHFLNANNESVNGEKVISIVDKDFVSAKEFKKYSTASKMECVKTGKMGDTRVYHVII